jgi:hypothetical protein
VLVQRADLPDPVVDAEAAAGFKSSQKAQLAPAGIGWIDDKSPTRENVRDRIRG